MREGMERRILGGTGFLAGRRRFCELAFIYPLSLNHRMINLTIYERMDRCVWLRGRRNHLDRGSLYLLNETFESDKNCDHERSRSYELTGVRDARSVSGIRSYAFRFVELPYCTEGDSHTCVEYD